MKSYDDVMDEHVGHTEDEPGRTCLVCKKKGWVEEKKTEPDNTGAESDDTSDKIQKSDEASGYVKQGLKAEMEAGHGGW